MFELSATPLDVSALRASLMPRAEAGALVTFEGWVRNESEGRSVTALTYEAAEELCRSEAEKIFGEARAKYRICEVRVAHRVGTLQVGEVAVWVGVTAPHRDAAFGACRYVMDELKRRLPIWKKEHYTGEPSRWVGV
ncbi:MAG: molybdenum cofactor biosynthesis protein MoaE [Verrucomicrobiae bacterium]|nr:molybdenum cofactor biosynthesis protein MoaE [Verrucomicrobiae bacterium]